MQRSKTRIVMIEPSNNEHPILGWFLEVVSAVEHLNDIVPKLLDPYYKSEMEKMSKDIDSLDDSHKITLYHALDTYKRMQQLHQSKPILWDTDESIKSIWDRVFNSFFLEGHTKYFIREMSLVYLITTFEELVKQILIVSYLSKPEMLMSKEKNLSTEEILKYNDYDTLVNVLAEAKVSNIINKDPCDLAVFLNDKFQLDLTKEFDWKVFTERFYRRHLIIHQKGRIDDRYRKKTAYQGKDERVHTDEKYLNDSIHLFKHFAKVITNHFVTKFKI